MWLFCALILNATRPTGSLILASVSSPIRGSPIGNGPIRDNRYPVNSTWQEGKSSSRYAKYGGEVCNSKLGVLLIAATEKRKLFQPKRSEWFSLCSFNVDSHSVERRRPSLQEFASVIHFCRQVNRSG
eukprot:superscaffoldBa00008646_g23516